MEVKKRAQNKNMSDFIKLIDWITENNTHLGVRHCLWNMDKKVKGKKQEFRCEFVKDDYSTPLFKIKIVLDHTHELTNNKRIMKKLKELVLNNGRRITWNGHCFVQKLESTIMTLKFSEWFSERQALLEAQFNALNGTNFIQPKDQLYSGK